MAEETNDTGNFVTRFLDSLPAGQHKRELDSRLERERIANEKGRLDLDERKAARSWDGAADILAPIVAPAAPQQPAAAQQQAPVPGMDDEQPAAATPAAAAAGGVRSPAAMPAQQQPAGPQRPEDRIGYALFQNPALAQDPGVDQRMRAYFAKNKNESGAAWWDSVKKAQNENFFAASHAALADDLEGAKKQFNASGKYQVNDLQWADAGKTTLRATLADGRTININPGEEMKRLLSPEKYLEFEAARAEKRIQKVGNNSLVRVNKDGTATPLYEADQFGNTPDGEIYSKRTGQKVEAGGVNQPKPGGREQARMDDRVKMAIDKVILPKYGGRFEGGMFFPDDANKDVALRATELAGQYVRQGMDPEAAGSQAVAVAEREKALKPKPGAAAPYNGPAPWKKPPAAGGTREYVPPARGAPAGAQGGGTR